MQMYWLKWNGIPWKENDITTKFSGTICTNEEKTVKLKLEGKFVKAVICIDYPSEEIMSKTVTLGKSEGTFEFVFIEDELPQIGEWKIEIYVLDEYGEIIGMTHHDDFDVI